jgi:hypothetical protein
MEVRCLAEHSERHHRDQRHGNWPCPGVASHLLADSWSRALMNPISARSLRSVSPRPQRPAKTVQRSASSSRTICLQQRTQGASRRLPATNERVRRARLLPATVAPSEPKSGASREPHTPLKPTAQPDEQRLLNRVSEVRILPGASRNADEQGFLESARDRWMPRSGPFDWTGGAREAREVRWWQRRARHSRVPALDPRLSGRNLRVSPEPRPVAARILASEPPWNPVALTGCRESSGTSHPKNAYCLEGDRADWYVCRIRIP